MIWNETLNFFHLQEGSARNFYIHLLASISRVTGTLLLIYLVHTSL